MKYFFQCLLVFFLLISNFSLWRQVKSLQSDIKALDFIVCVESCQRQGQSLDKACKNCEWILDKN